MPCFLSKPCSLTTSTIGVVRDGKARRDILSLIMSCAGAGTAITTATTSAAASNTQVDLALLIVLLLRTPLSRLRTFRADEPEHTVRREWELPYLDAVRRERVRHGVGHRGRRADG